MAGCDGGTGPGQPPDTSKVSKPVYAPGGRPPTGPMDETRWRASAVRAPRRAGPDGGRTVHSRADRRRLAPPVGTASSPPATCPPTGSAEAIATTRSLTGAPFGVNLFVPSAPGDPGPVAAYAETLRPEADRLGVALGEPTVGGRRLRRPSWTSVESARVHLVSFTFGCPTSETVDRLHRADIQVAVTVTSVLEAELAVEAGADLLAVQGTEAGGHQGSFVDLAANRAAAVVAPRRPSVRRPTCP